MIKNLLGKLVTKEIYTNLKEEIESQKIKPKLAVIILGDDPASEYYVKMLNKKGSKIGIEIKTLKFEKNLSQKSLLEEINKLNLDDNIHGIMIQKPLPKQISDAEVILKINPKKDVDAFHPLNIGNMVLSQDSFIPSTPAAVLEMFRFYNIETIGKHIVILGRSNIVGKPLANLLIRKDETGNATVTICHSQTANIEKITKTADILIAAIGRPKFVSKEMIKKNAIVIDVGVNQIFTDDGSSKYVGDVDYHGCFEKSLAITPVPGGVGSVTTAKLLQNVMKSAKNFNYVNNFVDEK